MEKLEDNSKDYMPKELERRSLPCPNWEVGAGSIFGWVWRGVFHFSKKPQPSGDFLRGALGMAAVVQTLKVDGTDGDKKARVARARGP